MSEIAEGVEVVEEEATIVQKMLAELIGTFTLVFIGCGAALLSGANVMVTGTAFGLTVLTMAYAFGRVSGGHFNPAVTLGAAIAGRLPWKSLPLYWVVQGLGGILAGGVLFVVMQGFPGFDVNAGFATNGFGDQTEFNFAWWAALLLEFVLTAIFLLVILGTTDARSETSAMAPLAIGLSLAMIHYASIPATGTSVNPARSVGVALYAGMDHIAQLWVFILAPLLGAAVAGALYPLLFGGPKAVPGSGLGFGGPRTHEVDSYQQQWNQQDWQAGAWQGQHGGQPQQQWGAPQQPAQQWDQPAQGAPSPRQWDQPAQQPPAQQPPAQQWGQPAEPPRQFGQDWQEGDDDGRTQIRPND
ncbi:MAG: MIP family channel protein [Nocardioides sp.]|jgi:MIP family channel proteins